MQAEPDSSILRHWVGKDAINRVEFANLMLDAADSESGRTAIVDAPARTEYGVLGARTPLLPKRCAQRAFGLTSGSASCSSGG
jgi:hypothetical protein